MDATTMFGGAAIFTTIGLVWDKIKFFFSRLSSLFIVTARIDGIIPKAIEIYCLENFKKSPFQPLAFSSFKNYIKKNKKHQQIAYEAINWGTNVVFWNGWKPLVIGVSSSGTFSQSTNTPSAVGEQLANISFFRGTFDLETMIIDAVTLFNLRTAKSHKRIRFCIRRHFGSVGGSDQKMARPSGSRDEVSGIESTGLDVFLGDKRILGFDPNEVGDNEDNSRNLTVLAFPKEIDDLVQEIERWKNSEDWYIRKSIPWKRGLLLHGAPGTGKTSLVKALGQYLDLPIHVFDLAGMSNYDFTNAWGDALENTPCIALVEDIDAVFSGRENIRNKNNNMDLLTFDCFLNNIDGVQNTDGLFLVVTTNRVELLDEALGRPRTDKHINGTGISTRPGRIDRAFELKKLDLECRRKIANRILSDCPEHIEKMIEEGFNDTPAQFQERLTQIALKYFWEHKK